MEVTPASKLWPPPVDRCVDVELGHLARALALERARDLDVQRAGVAAALTSSARSSLPDLIVLVAGERLLEQLVDVGARARPRRRRRPPPQPAIRPAASRATRRRGAGVGAWKRLQRSHAATSSLASGSWESCEPLVAGSLPCCAASSWPRPPRPRTTSPGAGLRRTRARARTTGRCRRPRMAAPPRRAGRAPTASRRAAKKRRTVDRRAQARCASRGAITPEEYALRRAAYEDAKRRASAARAARGGARWARVLRDDRRTSPRARQLTRSRLAPLWLTLDRNLEWWTTGALLRSGQRIEFEGSELVWQYYPGQGHAAPDARQLRQAQRALGQPPERPAASSCSTSCCRSPPSAPAGVAWEYYFSFGGGRPPWVSGLAQGTAVQALARAADAAAPRGRRAADRQARRSAIFRSADAAGRARAGRARRPLRDLLVRARPARAQRLHPVADRPLRLRAARRRPARRPQLFEAGRAARRAREVPALRHRRVVAVLAREQHARVHLSYHDLLQGFLAEPVHADGRPPSTARPPSTSCSTRACRRWSTCSPAGCAAAATGRVRFTLSKISTVDLRITRGGTLVEARPFGAVGYGKRHASAGTSRAARAPTRCS